MLKMNKKKGASLCFDQIKNKKVASSVFWEIKNKNKNLPASSVFQKSGLRNTCLFFFSLIIYKSYVTEIHIVCDVWLLKGCVMHRFKAIFH